MVEYNENMGFILYDNGEIEIVEQSPDKDYPDIINKKWHFYFHDVYQLVEAIKKAKPELSKQLKKLL